MKRTIVVAVCWLYVFIAAACTGRQPKEATFYVAPSGNDSWSGRLAEPNKKGTDGPFATLLRSRDAVRELKKQGPLPSGGLKIYIRGGEYSFAEPLRLAPEDSGSQDAPIVWSAYPGETVSFIGGKYLYGFEPVKDLAMLARLDENCRDSIVFVDLKAQGINNYGEVDPQSGRRMELFFDRKYMTIARYPNEGWLNIASVPQFGEKLINEGRKEWVMFGVPRGCHYGRFAYSGDRPKRWSPEDEIYADGYWVYDWSEQVLRIKKIDTEKREVYPQEPHHHYGYQQEARYYFLNVLEELDAPGEFYIDRANGILYFYPPSPVAEGRAVFPVLEDYMLTIDETSHITFQGITFEGSRSGAIKMTGGSKNTIAGCTFRNLGNDTVIIEGGTNNGVVSCDIYDVSGGGIKITGGDRKTLTPAGSYAVNNHIHHFARVFRTYRPAIALYGVGNRIANNYMHDAPHVGVWFEGNEHVLEYNDLTRIAQETGDVGGFNSAFDWTYRGNIIRYNFFHNIHGPVYLGCMTIYLDMPVGGTHVYGNVFYDLDKGFFTNSGRDNLIENNIFVKCNPSVFINVYYAPKEYALGGSWRMVERFNEMNYKEPPYSTRYPQLLTIFDGVNDPAIAEGNVVVRNVSYGGRFLTLHSDLDFSIVTVKDNLIADPEVCIWRNRDKKESEKFLKKYTYEDLKKELEKYGNVIIEGDPGFVDLEHENFQLKDDSPAYNLGFQRIPIEEIGLFLDEYRTAVPK